MKSQNLYNLQFFLYSYLPHFTLVFYNSFFLLLLKSLKKLLIFCKIQRTLTKTAKEMLTHYICNHNFKLDDWNINTYMIYQVKKYEVIQKYKEL